MNSVTVFLAGNPPTPQRHELVVFWSPPSLDYFTLLTAQDETIIYRWSAVERVSIMPLRAPGEGGTA